MTMLAILYLYTGCKKEYSFEGNPEDEMATGTLRNNTGDCAPITISGVYKQDSSLGEGNYVELAVHFASPGQYKIVTGTQNGFSFDNSSVISDTGYRTIKLKATGKPLQARTTQFIVSFDTSYCSFSVEVNPSVATIPTDVNSSDSAWKFSQGNRVFNGYFDGALTDDINGSHVLTLVGLTSTKDSAIAILIDMGGSVVKIGTFKSTTSVTFSFFDYQGSNIYAADKTTSGVELTVIITAYNAVTRVVEGTFSGTVLDRNNLKVTLSGGKFKAQHD